MATVLNLRRHRPAEKPEEKPPEKPPKKRRRRLVLLALLLLAIVFLPKIVAHTPLLRWILASATADLNGTLSVESASLGWFSPVVLRDVRLEDTEGNPVLQTPRLTGSKPLIALLLNSSMLGEFRLEKPKLTVSLRPDGSNLEDVLANYLAPEEEESEAVSVSLKVIDGSAAVVDQSSGQTWQIENLQLAFSTSTDDTRPMKLETSATIADPQRPGRLTAELTMRAEAPAGSSAVRDGAKGETPPPDAPASTGNVSIEASEVPLALLQPLIGRFFPQTYLAGRVSAEIGAEWGVNATLDADVATDNLRLATPALGGDRIELKHLHTTCRITRQGNRIRIEDSSLDCDLGSLSAAAVLQVHQTPGRSMPQWLLDQTYEIRGQVELVPLAEMLPGTLHLREGMEVTSGRVQLAVSSEPGPQGMIWEGTLESTDLRAVHRNRPLQWKQPIRLALAAHDSPAGPVLDNLDCQAEFLQLKAGQTDGDLAASAQFDLKQLADQLGQFVDLGELDFGGDGWALLHWKRAEEHFQIDAELHLYDFQLAMPGETPWTEEILLAKLTGNGRRDPDGKNRLLGASLGITAGNDRLVAELTGPVVEPAGGGTWPVELQVEGRLDAWPARLGPWIKADEYRVAGNYELQARGTGSADRIDLEVAKLTVDRLRLSGPSLNVEEPRVELEIAGSWDPGQGQLRLQPASLTGSSLSVRADDVVLAMAEERPMQMTGDVKFQGDLEPLSRWFSRPEERPEWRMTGQLSGRALFEQSAGTTAARLDAKVVDLVVVDSSNKRLVEPEVHLVARGNYQQETGTLELQQADLASTALAAGVTGRLELTDEQTTVDLAGELNYDLERLAVLLRPYLGPQIRIAGRGAREISYRGPLDPAKAQGNAALAWQSADVYGFPIGPGDMKATLAGGVLRAQPMDLTISRGQVRLAPEVRFSDLAAELVLPSGSLARQVQITPQMCNHALQYIAPVLAGATQASGTFSIEMDNCRIPLGDPAQGELGGRLTIHSVQIGPGPLLRELALLLGRTAPARLRRQSVVEFRMVDGRVHHKGLELVFSDVTVRTHGSVGLDQTLALTAEMPVPPKWIGNNPLGAAFRGQTIRLPISGTLSRPKIDRRQFDRIGRQLLQDATRNVIEHELNRQLERLLGPPPGVQ